MQYQWDKETTFELFQVTEFKNKLFMNSKKKSIKMHHPL